MELGALCGMSESEFWDSTPRYMSAKIRALESAQRLAWEQSRYIAFHAIKPGDHKNRLKKLTDLGKFPWERTVFVKQTREEYDSFNDDADEVLKVMNPGAYEAYMAGKQNSKNGTELFSES